MIFLYYLLYLLQITRFIFQYYCVFERDAMYLNLTPCDLLPDVSFEKLITSCFRSIAKLAHGPKAQNCSPAYSLVAMVSVPCGGGGGGKKGRQVEWVGGDKFFNIAARGNQIKQ